MYAWCQHQRPEGKAGAHKLKRLAYREEIAVLMDEYDDLPLEDNQPELIFGHSNELVEEEE